MHLNKLLRGALYFKVRPTRLSKKSIYNDLKLI